MFAGKALTEAELCELLAQVEADLKDDRIAEYGVDILFAHHPVIGGFRFGALPMQILPVPAEAPRPPQTYAHHPFLFEYPMRAYRTPRASHAATPQERHRVGVGFECSPSRVDHQLTAVRERHNYGQFAPAILRRSGQPGPTVF